MNQHIKQGIIIFISLLVFHFCCSCESLKIAQFFHRPVEWDLDEIHAIDTLRVITRSHPLTYYLYRGTRRGFDFELIQQFAKEQGLFLEVVIAPNWEDMIPYLYSGRGDIIATMMTVTPAWRKQVKFTHPYLEVQQVAVGTKENQPPMTLNEFAGRTIFVRKGSSYDECLQELRDEGINLSIAYVKESLDEEDPIERVAQGELPLTVVDNTVAKLEQQFYPGLEIGISISEPQPIAWAVRPNAHELLKALNDYLSRQNRSTFFNILKKRYFDNPERFLLHRSMQLALRNMGRISRFDSIFRDAANQFGFDWLQLVAQSYHESNFNPDKVSWAGAIGLMQLMPETAQSVGVKNLHDPSDNIHGGARYMRYLTDLYANAEKEDRWELALAAYNCGLGHLSDAREIVRQDKQNPDDWKQVRLALLHLEKPEFYQRAKYGYCNGSKVIHYVQSVIDRYNLFKALIPDGENESCQVEDSQRLSRTVCYQDILNFKT